MRTAKQKAVVNADKRQLDQVQDLVRRGRFGSVSEFFREAVAEKLARIEHEQVADAVERYCTAGYADEDTELIRSQAFPGKTAPRKKKETRRAPR